MSRTLEDIVLERKFLEKAQVMSMCKDICKVPLPVIAVLRWDDPESECALEYLFYIDAVLTDCTQDSHMRPKGTPWSGGSWC